MPNVYSPCVIKPKIEFKETFTPLGEKVIKKARVFIADNGEHLAEPGDDFPLDTYIQSFKASTDIVTIISKLQAGDESVINYYPNGGLTGDMTILPKNINDVQNIDALSERALESFNQFPDDIKALFNNDSSVFFAKVLDGSADGLITTYFASLVKQEKEKEAAASEGENE